MLQPQRPARNSRGWIQGVCTMSDVNAKVASLLDKPIDRLQKLHARLTKIEADRAKKEAEKIALVKKELDEMQAKQDSLRTPAQ